MTNLNPIGLPPTPPVNNRQVRRSVREQMRAGFTVDQDKTMVAAFNRTRDEAVRAHSGVKTFAEVVYSRPAYINNFLLARKRGSEIKSTRDPSGKARYGWHTEGGPDDTDIFNEKVSGLTLSEIEKMPIPLASHDIKRVTKIFSNRQDKYDILRRLLVFASQNALSEGQVVPVQLKPLYNVTTDLLNYYRDQLFNMHATVDQDSGLAFWLGMRGLPYLPQALGSYIPASIGITPSSTLKALEQKCEAMGSSLLAQQFKKKVVHRIMAKETADSYRRNVLPQDLEQYVHYSPEKDERAKAILEASQPDFSDDDSLQFQQESRRIRSSLAPYFGTLLNDVNKSLGKRLVFQPQNEVIHNVTVTSQDRRVLILVLHFSDGQTHLTVEMDRRGGIYGFPPDLAINNLALLYKTFNDIAQPILDYTVKAHPEVGRKQQKYTPPVREDNTVSPVLTRQTRLENYVPIPRPRTGIRQIAQNILANVGDKPLPSREAETRQHIVIYSRKKIEEAMGRHPNPKDVDLVMREIKDFEFGRSSAKLLKWSGGERHELRAGRWRVILNHRDRNFYRLETVGDRKEVLKDYADSLNRGSA